MLSDARTISHDSVLGTDVCIVGGGPAGITLARSLAGSSLKVTLLESGGLEEGPDTQLLAQGEVTGLPYYPLDETRFRLLGGASNRWAGWCRPLDRQDLQERSWIPASGWPIEFDELEPHYREAAKLCQLQQSDFATSNWTATIPELYGPSFVRDGVQTSVWQGSPPTKFGAVYRDDLRRAAALEVLLHANAVELETGGSPDEVTAVRVMTLEGRRFRVRARAYVLTAGAIETARLLLASNAARPAGLGNDHDLVGRYFMEHPHVVTGRVRLAPRGSSGRATIPAVDKALTGAYARIALQRPSGNIKCAYTLEPELREREGLLNFSAHLSTGNYRRREESEAYVSLKLVVGNLRSPKRLAEQVRDRTLPAGLGKHVRNLLTNLDEVGGVVADEVLRQPTHLELFAQTEQSPNPDSRVTLGSGRDSLGMPQPQLDWRLTSFDKWSIRRSQELLSERFEAAGIGTVEPEEWVLSDDDRWGATLHGGHHHLGTARMHERPESGVVDPQGKVHGVRNLYVADSSVFPTGGYANPMLTIVALALRSSQHLRSVLTGR